MSAETDLRAVLVAAAGVTALVSTRISADRMEQGAARPFVVFSRTGTDPLRLLDGTVLKTRATLDVTCWADTRSAADAVADAVTTAIRAVVPQSISGRAAAYDPDMDLEATSLTVEWWE